ncbi:hypothetical protein ACDX78_20725 [Virgibacillus oceani]
MSKEDKLRDEFINRLYSFLLKEGGISISQASRIKSHVLCIKTINNKKYILKKHKNKEILYQQWEFFKATDNGVLIPFHPFPNGRGFLTYKDSYYTISPYVEGKKLNYKFSEDRKAAVATVKKFHRKARNIYIKRPVNKKPFFIKWYDRLLAFKQTEALFNKYGFDYLYRDIVKTTGVQLRLLSGFPWDKLERDAKWNGHWVHGDVASHNFIKSAQNTFMIDFDLLHCTTQLYDFIQLGQRFVPHENWEIEELRKYNMVDEDEIRIWAYAMAVPSDVLREWLHFLNKKPSGIPDYLKRLDKEWGNRRYFLKSIEKVLN